MRRAGFLAPLFALIVLTAPACADGRAGAVYDPEADAAVQVDAVLAEASDRRVPALIVFGANWCHDSRGFADRITTEDALGAFMADHYALAFVDIGVRHRSLDQAARFGVNAVHGTPTLVIAQGPGLAENAATVHDWRAVYNAGDADLATYFARYAATAPAIEADAGADVYAAALAWPPYQSAMAGIDALPVEEQAQARDYYYGLARSLARNAMGRVGEAEGRAVASMSDLQALGLAPAADVTDAVIARMAEMDMDLAARRARDLADTQAALDRDGAR